MLLLTAAVGVETAAAAALEEVIVTAQKREQKAQDVGIAMTVMNGDEIASLHYTNASDLAAQSPGVETRRQFPSAALRSNFFIRGVGSTDFNDATETPIASLRRRLLHDLAEHHGLLTDGHRPCRKS